MRDHIPAITQKQVCGLLPKRPPDSHKGMFGTVVVIGGAIGMTGAPLLAARAALKLGAGCVHVGLLAENAPVMDAIQPELMLHSAHDALKLCIDSDPKRKDPGDQPTIVIAIGCGMGHDLAAQKILYHSLKLNAALVLDADALTLLARHTELQDDLRARETPAVITPHPGEAALLLACTTQAVQADRTGAARQLAQKLRCSVVLKGANSLCVTRTGKMFANKTGNPGMSSAGMGDALTGIIAAMIAQGLSADDAMLLAVHLHGAAGDALAQQGISVGMTASELTEWARWLLNQWTSNA